MSNNSNDPQRDVTIDDVTTGMRISVSATDNTAYVFIGQTPRSQLAIAIKPRDDSPLSYWQATLRGELKCLFPTARVTFQ